MSPRLLDNTSNAIGGQGVGALPLPGPGRRVGETRPKATSNAEKSRTVPQGADAAGETAGGAEKSHRLVSSTRADSPDQLSITRRSGTEGVAEASVADDDDTATTNITSVTLELRKAAKKTICHARSKRAAEAAIPPRVVESILRREFPHVRSVADGEAFRGGLRISVNSTMVERSVDAATAERSVDSSAGCHRWSEEFDEAFSAGPGVAVDYNDCVRTIAPQEMMQLRSAMQDHEKQRVMFMMDHLSHQMQSFHEVLEENHALKDEVNQVRRENEEKASELGNKISELEEALIEMKLNLAQCQSREDHHRLSMAKLHLDLSKAGDENRRLRQMLSEAHDKRAPEAETDENVGTSAPAPPNSQSMAARRNSLPAFTKSMSSADSPESNVRSGNPMKRKNCLLTNSWFGGNGLGFLERSSRREEQRRGHHRIVGGGLAGSLLVRRDRASPSRGDDAAAEDGGGSPPSPKPSVLTKSLSFVDPKKARAAAEATAEAPGESEFMPWGASSCEKSYEEDIGAGVCRPKPARSRSFVDPKEVKTWREPIGSDLFLPLRRVGDRGGDNDEGENFGSRSTFLSAITDATFEDADNSLAVEEVVKAVADAQQGQEQIAPKSSQQQQHQQTNETGRSSGIDSRGSQSTLEFEPAKPQLQRTMSLRGVHEGETPRQRQLREEASSRVRAFHASLLGSESRSLQSRAFHSSLVGGEAQRLRLQQSLGSRGFEFELPPQLREAMSLREDQLLRGRGREDKSALAGDANLAFC